MICTLTDAQNPAPVNTYLPILQPLTLHPKKKAGKGISTDRHEINSLAVYFFGKKE